MQTKLKWKNTKNENLRKIRKLIEAVVCVYRNSEFTDFGEEEFPVFTIPCNFASFQYILLLLILLIV